MRKFMIYPKYKKPRLQFKSGDMGKTPEQIPNLLKPILKENRLLSPNQVWSSDFTYLKYKSNFLYLATVIDSFSKDIVGFEINLRHTEELVSKALVMATRQAGKSQIIHSDQGSEYRSYNYQNLLKYSNIQISMSKKSSPWENGFQESFYGKFKQELGSLNQYESMEKAIEAIYRQIYYYNHQRIHTTIRDIPVNFRRKCLEQNQRQLQAESLERSV
jgi:transposase InsO family protein